MTRIRLSDPRVGRAYTELKELHKHEDSLTFSKIFEEIYKCNIVADPEDIFCLDGWLEMTEDKYYTWFAIKFGDSSE